MDTEWLDVVHEYVWSLYQEKRKPVSAREVVRAMMLDLKGTNTRREEIETALDVLATVGFIERKGRGYVPLEGKRALMRQLELPEVQPFTREYGESPEAHIDKVWDFREAIHSGPSGYQPTAQYYTRDSVWRGLLEGMKGRDLE